MLNLQLVVMKEVFTRGHRILLLGALLGFVIVVLTGIAAQNKEKRDRSKKL